MRYSIFMVWMTLVLSFALLGQVEARNGRLNKRRLSLERRGAAAAAAGQNGNTGVSGNNIGGTDVLAQAIALSTAVNQVSTQVGSTAGSTGPVGQAASGAGAMTGIVTGLTGPKAG